MLAMINMDWTPIRSMLLVGDAPGNDLTLMHPI
jgi:hypothetical protein